MMAKRLKLSDETKAPRADVQKSLQMQGLLTTPDGIKLTKLDDEMSAILKQTGLNLDEKVRQYETKLGEFRSIQTKIVREGGVNLVEKHNQTAKNVEDGQQLGELIRTILTDVLGPLKTSLATDPTIVQDNVLQPATGPLESQPIHNTPVVAEAVIMPTPKQSMKTKRKLVDENHTPHQSPKANIDQFLVDHGMAWEGGRAVFKDFKRNKRSENFAKSTYDNAMKYLFDQTGSVTKQRSWDGLINIVQTKMQENHKTYSSILKRYPNFKTSNATAIDAPNWVRV